MYQYTPAQHKELQKKRLKQWKSKKQRNNKSIYNFHFARYDFPLLFSIFCLSFTNDKIVRFIRCEVFVLFSLVISFYGLEISFFLFVSLFILLLGGWLIVNILYKMCECIFLILLKEREEEKKLYKEGIT